MHIQGLPGQNQTEELVTGGTDGSDLRNVVVIGEQGHKAGDAAFHLDLEQDVRRGKAALRPAGLDVVHHHAGDAFAFRVVDVLFVAGKYLGLVGLRRGLRRSRRAGCTLTALAAAGGLAAAAGSEYAGRHENSQYDTHQSLHVILSICLCIFCTGRSRGAPMRKALIIAPGAACSRFSHFTPTPNRCKANGNFYALSPKSQEKVCISNLLKRFQTIFPRLWCGDRTGTPTPQPLIFETMGYPYHTHFFTVCKHFVIFAGNFSFFKGQIRALFNFFKNRLTKFFSADIINKL